MWEISVQLTSFLFFWIFLGHEERECSKPEGTSNIAPCQYAHTEEGK